MKIKNSLSALARVVISFGLLGGLFWLMRDEFRNIWRTMMTCDVRFIFAAAAFLCLTILSLSWRLKIVFNGEDLTISFGEAFQLTCVGYFFNNFMPTAVGGDIIKAHYAAHFNRQKLKSYASVLMDRFIGLFTIVMIAAVALAVDRGRFEVAIVRPLVVILLVLGVSGAVIATNKGIARFLERAFLKLKMFQLGEKLHAVYTIVHDYRNRKDVVAKSIALSTLAQSVYYAIIYFLFLSLGRESSLGNVFLIMPVVIFMSMIPSIGGLGVREGAMVAFFSPVVGKDVAFAGSLLLLAGLFLVSMVGGVFYLWWGFTGTRDKTEDEQEEIKI